MTLERLQQQFKQDPLLALIQKNLPAAFVQGSPDAQKDYCRALLNSRLAKAAVQQVFKPLQGLSEFAAPLLTQALDSRFGQGLEVSKDTLFHGVSRDEHSLGLRSTSLTLLEAALHNFERKEARNGGFTSNSAILKGSSDMVEGTLHPKNIKPEQFAELCRHLNLGRKYQDHLDSVLEPASKPGDAPDAARLNARAALISNDIADMELCARASLMRKTISEAACKAVVGLSVRQTEARFNGEPLRLWTISLLEQEVSRIVLISPYRTWTFTPVPWVLYIPQDPICPMKEYSSLTEVENDLRSRLMFDDYRQFFARFIGERNRAAFFSRMTDHLFPIKPIDGNPFSTGLRRPTPDHSADLLFDTEAIPGDLFKKWHDQQLFLIRDNARFLAVPTEDEDARSRRERLKYWLDIGMNIANAASFLVPVLGQVMFVYASVELVGEVYHGLEDLSHGDLEQGLDHLMGAAANIAFMVALGKAANGAALPEPPPITSNHFTGKVIPITLNNGQTRLWKPDLTPFQSRVQLPEGASPDLNGIIEHEGKHFLNLDGQRYQVQHQPALNKWRIKHPYNDHPFSPSLEHNEVGAFRHEGERPEQWAKHTLFKRLGHSVDGLSDIAAQQILRVVDADVSLLRQVHLQNAVPPGHLADSIKRFQLDRTLEAAAEQTGNARNEAFERLYSASEVTTDLHILVLCRDFPGLPTSVAEELIATSLPAERQQLLDSGHVSLRLGEAAAWHLRQTRLNRALEGFYLKSVANPDTETLSLGLLKKLPGWSDQVRLEVRRGTTRGELLQSIGAADAPELKYLVKTDGRYQAFDAEHNALNNLSEEGNNLTDSILHALPDGSRRLIGFAHVAQGLELNEALAQLAASNRTQASRLLGQRQETLKFNVPQRLNEGRLGYPLSGRGRLEGFVLEEHLLDKIRLLELEDLAERDVLASLRSEGLSSADINARLNVLLDERQQLRNGLDQWARDSASLPGMSPARQSSRTRIGEAIIRHWRDSSVPPGNSVSAVLRLDSVALADYPMRLPAFVYQRVEQLELVNSVLHIDPPRFPELMGVGQMGLFEGFIRQFGQMTSLTITRPFSPNLRLPDFQSMPRAIAVHLPNLRALSLINQSLLIQAEAIEHFSSLAYLERLDLSGNNCTLLDEQPVLFSANLRRLGLDRVGLQSWPTWLNDLMSGPIDEVSLADNLITHLPDSILRNPDNASHTTHLVLRGNRLSRRAIIRARLHDVGPWRSFNLDLDVPVELQTQINELLREQAELDRALRDWTEASGSSAPINEETLTKRRLVARDVMEHWRNSVSEHSSQPVRLESMALSNFPQSLPETFYRNVNGLELRNVAADQEQLARFLRRFQQLSSLDIMGHVPMLEAPPAVLAELSSLRELGLVDHGMLVDQQAMEFLSRLNTVVHLDLSGNRMGAIVDSPILREHYWQSLTLDNTGLQSWPEWLDELVPGNISSLSLNNNQLVTLPSEILQNPRNDMAHTEIALEGNPLSRDTMIAAHVFAHGGHRSFSFHMDLPDDIAAMSDEAHSDSETSDSDSNYSEHAHGRVTPDNSLASGVEPWLEGTPEEQAIHRSIWEQVEAAEDAPMFMMLIGRLQETADYLRARELLIPRVWHVLQAASQDTELRLLLDGMAQEAIFQRTCGDGVRLEFNQMEVQVYTRDSLRDVPANQRGQTLYRLMTRLFRLDEVDRLARLQHRGRDEAEVRLAYRLRLADSLDLPLPPSNMLYRAVAGVTSGELLDVQGLVLDSQNNDAFFSGAANRDFWSAYLRETYTQEFAALKTVFEQRQSQLEDEFPDLNDEYLARINALAAEHKEQELELIKQLTHRDGLKYGE
ncbi:MAG: hypothetical protein JWP80_3774 [Pseudomonas sp.]|nr:hypothetical protein [Pseudomonas sp.]